MKLVGFVEKSILLGAKIKKDRTVKRVYLPDLLREGSMSLTDIFRIHVPFFVQSKMVWNENMVDITLKNIGTATKIKEVIFSGNEINWNPSDGNRIDLQNPKVIKRNDRLRLQSIQVKNKETRKITIICENKQYQFNLYKDKDGIRIEKVRMFTPR